MSQRTPQRHTRRRRVSLQVVAAAAAVVLLVVIGVLALGSTDSADPPADSTTLSLTEFAFSPDPIVLDGSKATLFVVNDGDESHNLLINALGKGTPDLGPGEVFQIDLSDQPAGTYPVICDLPGHAAAGMVTELTIE